MKKKVKIIAAIIAIAVVCGLLYSHIGKNFTPSVSAKSEAKVPEEILSEIINTERGFYNANLPLFARRIEILDATDKYILYKVNYFPCGSIERSYSSQGAGEWIFNLEKPLTRLSSTHALAEIRAS